MKYVINMLARPKNVTTTQVMDKNVNKAMDVYLKSVVTCLSSVRYFNRGIEDLVPILFANFDIDEPFRSQLESINAKIVNLHFGEFSISEKFGWSIAQYRFDVMKYITENFEDDDIAVILDTDVLCTGPLNDMFEELTENLLLYNTNHSFSNVDRHHLVHNYQKIYGKIGHFAHYGGEFTGGKISLLKNLFEAQKQVMTDSGKVDPKEFSNMTEETITSIAVYRSLRDNIGSANPYMFRFWTQRFYLAGTQWNRNKVQLWHMPAEKDGAFIYFYNYYTKHECFPKLDKMAKICGFPKKRQRKSLARFFMKIKTGYYLKRIKKAFNILIKRITGEK